MVFAILFGMSATCFSGDTKNPDVSAKAFVLYCADSGEVLLSKNMSTQMPMASTTKIMTSLIALEYAQQEDKRIEFTKEMCAEGSSMYLKAGDKVKLSDLAAGMMMVSGNDAANAAALGMCGSVEDFAQIMNTRAKKIGMKNTNFTNPSGLPDDNHYSTAYDMALLMTEAMDNVNFASLTIKQNVRVDFTSPQGHSVTYSNHNRLLSMYEYCTGGKTGYTKEAGRCLVTSAEKDGLRLVAVTFDAPDDWQDHISLYNYGFENFTAGEPIENSFSIDVMGGTKENIMIRAEGNPKCVLPASMKDKVQIKVYIPPFLFAPVKKGDEVGRIVLTVQDETVAESKLVVCEDVNSEDVSALKQFAHRLIR